MPHSQACHFISRSIDCTTYTIIDRGATALSLVILASERARGLPVNMQSMQIAANPVLARIETWEIDCRSWRMLSPSCYVLGPRPQIRAKVISRSKETRFKVLPCHQLPYKAFLREMRMSRGRTKYYTVKAARETTSILAIGSRY